MNTPPISVPVIREINGQTAAGGILFMDTPAPEISWRLTPGAESFRQAAYRLIVKDLKGRVVRDSGPVSETASSWRPWPGAPLNPRERVAVQVQLLDPQGRSSCWSEPCFCEYTLKEAADWGKAHWIWFDRIQYVTTPPSPYFRREFAVRGDLVRAELFITARGVFEAYLNGRKIGSDLLTPGWVDFRQQTPYVTYDVTEFLQPGRNALGAVLADGWCCGNLTVLRLRNFYHARPELLAHLELTYADGTRTCIDSDSEWQVSTGPILSADLYDGEFYDARQENETWAQPGTPAGTWFAAALGDAAAATPGLVQKTAPPVRVTEELQPVKIWNPQKDCYIWDFGQNFTGIYQVKLKGTAGTLYTFRTAEMLNADGTLYTLNYRNARSTDHYVCKENRGEFQTYTPHFTFHGFRYLQIDGFQYDKGKPEDLVVTGLVCRSDMPLRGCFSCGNELVSRLWQNALWGQKSNFLELPTDCPQRDERLGWSGDTQVFAPAAVLNMDCCSFYRKYLRDVREAMTAEGASPSIAPAVLHIFDGAAGWGDVIILLPLFLYRHYGWKGILQENYEAMCRSIAYQQVHSDRLLRSGAGQFGDWLAPEPTSTAFVATAFFAECTAQLAQIAELLGRKEDALAYEALAQQIRARFLECFTDASGVLTEKTQTALVLALAFHLLPEEKRKSHAQLLDASVRRNGGRLSTGFLGTPYLLPVLEEYGYVETARDLLLQEEMPSWLYSVKQGATTIWERWNSFSRQDGFGDVSMNSFNHYAYGIVSRYLLESLGGIHYKNDGVLLQIRPDGRFSPVHASYDSPFGRIMSHWQLDEKRRLFWEVEVPPGIDAAAILPDGQRLTLPAGRSVLCGSQK